MSDRPPVNAFTAFVAPIRGFATILTRPSLWPWAMTPPLVFAAFAAMSWVFGRKLFDRVDAVVAHAIGHGAFGAFGAAVAGVITAVVFVAAVLIAALWIVPPICAPFMDALASRIDTREGLEESLGQQIARSLRVALAGLFFVALPQVALAIVGLVVPPAAPVCIVIASAVGALGLAYDALDWPLSRRGLGVGARLAWMRAHPGVTFGLGAGAWIVSLVPGLVILALPSIVAGAVAVVNDVEAREGTRALTSGS